MSTHSTTHAHDHSNDWKLYLGILVALLILTVVTVAAAGVDFGSANVIIAVLIATVKASLVALFFMHLRHDSPINSIIFLSALLFLGFLLILCLLDINSRHDVKPYNWKGPEKGVVYPARDLGQAPQGTAAPTSGAADTKGGQSPAH